MLPLKNFPAPLKEKFVALIFISIFILLIGICMTIIFKDTSMLILSLLVSIFCIIKAKTFYTTVIKKEYETVTGTCTSITPILIRKQKKILISDDSGNERTLILSKNSKVLIGTKYIFYFKKTKSISLGSEYFDSILASDCFLGYEEYISEK